jgi:competence protein ComEC
MKRLLSFLPTHFTICLILGIVLQFSFEQWQISVLKSCLLFALILTTLLLFKLYKKQKEFTISSWVLFVFIGMFSVFIQDKTNQDNFYKTVSSSDSLIVFKVEKVLKSNLYYDKYLGSIEKVGSQITSGSILMNIQNDTIDYSIKIDDSILFSAEFIEVPKPLNPFQFNYRNYLKKQGIHHQVFLRNSACSVKKSSKKSIYKIADDFRRYIEESLRGNGFKNEELAVVKALLLGQRSDISKELLQDYTRAGAIHILAVSGLHVGIIMLILSSFFKPLERLKNGKLFKTILVVLFLWIFAVIAGLSASVVRAVTMFSIVSVGLTFNRKTLVLHSVITSMFVLLLFKPMFLFDVGFQLSYLAVFSIVIIQPKLSSLWNPNWKIVEKFWQLFTVSIAAQIGVLPISLFYFHQFPGLFMLSNLIIIPFIGMILIGGIVIIALSLLNVLPEFLARTYEFVIALMNDFVGWISLQESFLIKEISFSALLLIVSYLCIFFGFTFFQKRSFKSTIGFLLVLVFFQCSLLFEKNKNQSQNELIIFHKSRKTIIGRNVIGNLDVFHNLDTISIQKLSLIKNYKIGNTIKKVSYLDEIPNVVKLKNKLLIVVDSLGVYQIEKHENSIVLLRQSPKINLKRLIQRLKPIHIIADASNYKNDAANWKIICDKLQVPFQYTAIDGAVMIK